jgi:hypothetical protein
MAVIDGLYVAERDGNHIYHVKIANIIQYKTKQTRSLKNNWAVNHRVK